MARNRQGRRYGWECIGADGSLKESVTASRKAAVELRAMLPDPIVGALQLYGDPISYDWIWVFAN